MTNYIIKRLALALIVLFGVATIVFFLVRMTGDPVRLLLPPEATEEQVEEMRIKLGYDRPLYVQYGEFMGKLAQLDLGRSLRYNEPAGSLIMERIPKTVSLALMGIGIAVVLSFILGTLAALNRGKAVEQLIMSFSIFGQSMPAFWFGILLILGFAVYLRWLPTGGMGDFRNYILPAVALGLRPAALMTRMLRSSMVEVLDADFIRTARAKGLSRTRVILRHALRNSLLPVITLIGGEFGSILGGSVVIETIFAWPGIGQLLSQAISYRDFPLVQAVIITIAGWFVFVNLAVDILYAYVDPRIRYE